MRQWNLPFLPPHTFPVRRPPVTLRREQPVFVLLWRRRRLKRKRRKNLSPFRPLRLHKLFRPLAGTDSRLEDLRMRVITTLFCYGCNLGPVQTAKSIKGLSRRQISWLNLKYVSEDLLDKAIVKVINAYNKFELPGYWGTGKHASADGTKWNLYEQNVRS